MTMTKYIDRDALVEWLKHIPLIDLSDGRGLCRVIFEDDFKKAIKNIPKGVIVDAVPVVRCKDCKYGEVDDDLPFQYGCNYHGADWNDENHFCSYGERKDGDGNG